MVEVFDERVKELNDKIISLAYVKRSVMSSMERMLKYRFFWTDLYFLLKSNQRIRTHFEQVKLERKAGYKFLFDFLIQTNIMKKSPFTEGYAVLIERMIDYGNTWLYASLLYTVREDNIDVTVDYSFRLLSMIYPYLTNEGQREFRAIFPSFFPHLTK